MVRLLIYTVAVLATFIGTVTADVIDIKTRDSNIRILIEGPGKPSHVVALFAGGHGNVEISDDGSLGWGKGNFAVRTRKFLHNHGMTTVVVSAPGDNSNLKGRRSRIDYATDIENVMAYLRGRYPRVPSWMHGTSRGTISIAMTVPKFKSATNKPDGIILSASVTEPNNYDSVYDADLAALSGAVLIMAHKDDPCFVTPASSAPDLLAKLTKSRPKKLMILAGGGENASGRDCGARTEHGFIDMDEKAINAMAGWIKNPN